MISEIKRRLEAGERVELECIDRHSFINDEINSHSNIQILDQESLVVKLIDYRVERIILDGVVNPVIDNAINFSELKFFKIKEPAPSFDDLVDVVVQAAKGGLLEINMLNSEFITASIPGDHDSAFVTCWRTKQEIFESSINKVESLYTETFTIECEEDISKVRRGAVIKQQYGNELVAESGCKRHYVNYIQTTCGNMNFNLGFVSLKGATVTQKKDQ